MRNEKQNVSNPFGAYPDNPYAAGGIEWFQFADNTVMPRNHLIDAPGIQPTGTSEADVLSGTALGEFIVVLVVHRMKSRCWRNRDIAYAIVGWRVAA